MAIDVLWNEIKVAATDCRHIALEPQLHLLLDTFHPGELVVELCCTYRISVGQVYVHDANLLDSHFEKASVTICFVAK